MFTASENLERILAGNRGPGSSFAIWDSAKTYSIELPADTGIYTDIDALMTALNGYCREQFSRSLVPGDIIRFSSTPFDSVDTALATLKGSSMVTGDSFLCTTNNPDGSAPMVLIFFGNFDAAIGEAQGLFQQIQTIDGVVLPQTIVKSGIVGASFDGRNLTMQFIGIRIKPYLSGLDLFGNGRTADGNLNYLLQRFPDVLGGELSSIGTGLIISDSDGNIYTSGIIQTDFYGSIVIGFYVAIVDAKEIKKLSDIDADDIYIDGIVTIPISSGASNGSGQQPQAGFKKYGPGAGPINGAPKLG
jgi:hypothetical protein